jgi:hypothetical protein
MFARHMFTLAVMFTNTYDPRYTKWVRAGLRTAAGASADEPRCRCSQGKGKGKAGCVRCRKIYSMENSLNNKVLEAVHATVGAVERELSNPKWKNTIAKRGNLLTAGALERNKSGSARGSGNDDDDDDDEDEIFRTLSNPVNYDADSASDAVSSVSASSIASSIANSSSAPASEAGSDVGRMDDFGDAGDGIQHAPSAATMVDSTDDDSRKLGDCLLHAFPEQIGAFIIPGYVAPPTFSEFVSLDFISCIALDQWHSPVFSITNVHTCCCL